MKSAEDLPWLSGRVPNGFWERKNNRLAYMRWLGDRLGFARADDWYTIRRTHFQSHRGSGLLNRYYNDSPQAAVREWMPRRKWYPWLFSRASNRFWQDPQNRRAYMTWFRDQLGIEQKEDWYRVTKGDFAELGGAGLLRNYFGDSVAAAVKEYNPRIELQEWRFQTVPQGFWQSPENRRRYMDWLGVKLKIRTPDLWYGVTTDEVKNNDGLTLLTLCGGSLFRMVREYLPNHDWKPWLFHHTPGRFWDEIGNRRDYLHWLGEEVGYRKPQDWYQLREAHFIRTGAAALFLTYYDCSPAKAARERYPGFKWNPSGFQRHKVAADARRNAKTA